MSTSHAYAKASGKSFHFRWKTTQLHGFNASFKSFEMKNSDYKRQESAKIAKSSTKACIG